MKHLNGCNPTAMRLVAISLALLSHKSTIIKPQTLIQVKLKEILDTRTNKCEYGHTQTKTGVAMTTKEEVILSIFGMKCSLVGGKVKVLDTFSKPFSLLEQNIELEADHEYTRLWEERLQSHIDTMRNDLPVLYEEWLDNLSTNKGDEMCLHKM